MAEQIPEQSFAAPSTRFSNLTEDFAPLTLQELDASLQEQEAQITAEGAELSAIRPSRQNPSYLRAIRTREVDPSTVIGSSKVLQSEVLYTALVSRGALVREGVVKTWSRTIKLITQRAYKSIVRQKTAKDKRMLAIESLEIIEKNLKWFVGFLKGYMGNFDALDDNESVNAVRPHYEELDKIARWIDEFLEESAKLKEKALKAE
ncbi:hypothetical protein FFLO_06350 [Filobasidium floriforme]|uniref:Uncharacterized protein n=1 Tax=Filobasidium floriforme TaxID=5210 RepID=A0A8K0JFI8_9TREE|nr:uncharacterized protein HD553DRAFT_335106 [Filobasidium floriforme]KAG7528179.1 hypothetical protein FFLO_06350 [Filobasidium floriforme]KAH8085898.1 hypothetical protein HD553DRAFT_335106 [Filobasidium floriforme]